MKSSHAYKYYANTNNVESLNSFNPELQLKGTESSIRNKLIDLLIELKGFKFVTTLVLEFKKIESNEETKCSTFYLTSKAETIINKSDIHNVFKSIYIMIISKMEKYHGKSLGWIIDSVIDHTINI